MMVTHTIQPRQAEQVHYLHYGTGKQATSFLYAASEYYDSIPNDIINYTTEVILRSKLKRHIINSYNEQQRNCIFGHGIYYFMSIFLVINVTSFFQPKYDRQPMYNIMFFPGFRQL